MKAIVTKYHGATNHKGSRVSATAEGGNRIMLPWQHDLNSEEMHRKAAVALAAKKGWTFCPLISGGGLPNGDTVHMFSAELKEAVSVLVDCRRAIGRVQSGERGGGIMGTLSSNGDRIDSFFAGIGYKLTEASK